MIIELFYACSVLARLARRYKRAVRGLHAVGDPEHAEKSFVQELGYLVSARRQNVEMRIEASAVTEWTSGCRDSRRR